MEACGAYQKNLRILCLCDMIEGMILMESWVSLGKEREVEKMIGA